MEKELIRLQKAIADTGFTSRRKAEELILAGRVKVNGLVVTSLGSKVNESAEIMIDDKKIYKQNGVSYLFNKPLGVLCTVKDDRGRPTVVDYFKDKKERLYPVGRLDFNTSGLLVMTNDGELANLMTHPSSHLNKTYVAKISRPLTNEEKIEMEKGIKLEDGYTAPCSVYIHENGNVSVTIHEGRNRQVRRMFEYFDIKVLALTRISIGFLKLENLKRGEYRLLTSEEVKRIKVLCEHEKAKNIFIKRMD